MSISSPHAVEIAAKHLAEICCAATAVYPDECCGLLIGSGAGVVSVIEIRPSANLAADRRIGFAVDPQIQFDALREFRGTSCRVVGHYHSHPNGQARPSAHDIAMAHEPNAVWMIVPVDRGEVVAPRTFLIHRGGEYSEISFKVLP